MNKKDLVILEMLVGFIATILLIINLILQITVGTVIMVPTIAVLFWIGLVLSIATKEGVTYTFIWFMCSVIWTIQAFNALGQ